jgi:hypothetical protein
MVSMMTPGLWCVLIHDFTCVLTLNVYTQALEEGEDIQELADYACEKKE